MNQPFGEAVILAHPQLTHAQAIEICRREGLRLVQTKRGNFIYQAGGRCWRCGKDFDKSGYPQCSCGGSY